MVKRRILTVLVFTFLSSMARAQVGFHDSLRIANLRIFPDIKSKDIYGIQVTFDYSLSYDTIHGKDLPNHLFVGATLWTTSGSQIKAIGENGFKDRSNLISESDEWPLTANSKKNFSLFIPYYAFDLPSNVTQLELRIKGKVADESNSDKTREIFCTGSFKAPVNIHKPALHACTLYCSAVRVAKTNHGKSWDVGLYPLPDPVIKIYMNNDLRPDLIYRSPIMLDSYSAGWIDPSPEFYYSEGDGITLEVDDRDTLMDDMIGSETHTLDEWLAISSEGKPIKFDQVEYCLVKVEKVPDKK